MWHGSVLMTDLLSCDRLCPSFIDTTTCSISKCKFQATLALLLRSRDLEHLFRAASNDFATISFTIDFKPQEPIPGQAGGTAQLLQLALPHDHPDFQKHLRHISLLCRQISQISGLNSEAGEQDVTSHGPSGNSHCWKCNNLSTAHISDGMTPIVRGFLSDFEASARDGCKICQLLLTSISPYQGPGRLKAYIRPGRL